MPQSLEMQEQFGDDVQVLLVSQGDDPGTIERFGLSKKWLNDRAIWTQEAPFQTGVNTQPHCVLLGIDGEVLLNDNPISAHSKIEELIAEQLKLAKKGPKDLPPALAKSWADFEKGGHAAAIQALRSVQDGPEKDAAGKLAATLETRAKAKVARLEWLIENAEFEQADKLAAQLVKGLAGHTTLEPKAKDLAAKLAAKEMATEREAASALAKIEKKMAKDGLDKSALKQLAGLGEKYPDTKAARRAAHLVQIVEG